MSFFSYLKVLDLTTLIYSFIRYLFYFVSCTATRKQKIDPPDDRVNESLFRNSLNTMQFC